ncbi:MAG: sulfite exporter TauE/SafE family protein [Ruminiclostridium sp.]|nr:sulfite exporter TauE/SafE family protein [Ruminiclostridium sp.]
MKRNVKSLFIGGISGILNGLFGSGGGIAAVPLLESTGIEPKKSHATSVALIFCLSIAATIGYYIGGNLNFRAALSYIPSGLLGAAVGATLLKKADNGILRRIFGGVMIISGIRMILR